MASENLRLAFERVIPALVCANIPLQAIDDATKPNLSRYMKPVSLNMCISNSSLVREPIVHQLWVNGPHDLEGVRVGEIYVWW